jgi:DNA invertase Pin-like site-specific DNA recombinase
MNIGTHSAMFVRVSVMNTRVALYCRMSTESQSYSIINQRTVLLRYAQEHDYEIVHSYEDPGVSGVSLKRRRGLRQLLNDVLSRRADFRKVLVYDVSRWGRFQDVDEAAHYEFLCRRAGIQVEYCAEQFLNDGSISSDLMKAIKRTMAGEYSRELSVKVAQGQKRMATLGYWMHPRAPYGYRRMVVSPTGKQIGLVGPGEHKFKTDRIILVLGPENEVLTVRKMFNRFLRRNARDEFTRIAEELDGEGLVYSTGAKWTRQEVRRVLTNPVYAGFNVWGRRSVKLYKTITENPCGEWAIRERAFEPIITPKIFKKTQEVIASRWHRSTDAELLTALRKIYKANGRITRKLMLHSPVAGPSTYQSRFGSLKEAYKRVGYEAPLKTWLANAGHTVTWNAETDLASRICSIFPSRVTVSRNKDCERPVLKLDTGECISILTCRSSRTKSGHPRWITYPHQISAKACLVLIAMFDSANRELASFAIIRTKDIPPATSKVRKDGPLMKKARKIPDLFYFYEAAQILCRTIGSSQLGYRNENIQ